MTYKIAFLLLISNLLFAQDKSQTYINISNSYYDSTNIKSIYEPTINEITLNLNSTFEFWSRPDYGCRSWKSYEGTWTKKKGFYFFKHEYDVFESDVRLHFKKDSQDIYIIRFRTDQSSELLNRDVKITYCYDFDSQIKDIDVNMKLSMSNSIEIPFANIPNHDKLASIRVEYLLNSRGKRFDFITESNIINQKLGTIPNITDFEMVEIPKGEKVFVLIKGKINKDTLEIISSEKTTSTNRDWKDEMKFKRFYLLQD
ncbi:MAG: hypothetical protein KA275_00075 [Chitinophagaceae bacterium]|nr:hypothetical protein [Chitinophagaceae bacterium]